jgi:hypothetical protein
MVQLKNFRPFLFCDSFSVFKEEII